MPWRLLRRCLLFGLLGLVTSVAVAWGAAVRWQHKWDSATWAGAGVAAAGDVAVGLVARRAPGVRSEAWSVWQISAPGMQRSPAQAQKYVAGHRELFQSYAALSSPIVQVAADLDEQAARAPAWVLDSVAPHIKLRIRERYGFPAPALGLRYRKEGPSDPTGRVVQPGLCDALRVEWPGARAFAPWPESEWLFIPVRPLPGLPLNTIFYGLLWALLLLAPDAIRRRIRRARGRCPKCGYSLAGQASPGCPECGAGRRLSSPAPV